MCLKSKLQNFVTNGPVSEFLRKANIHFQNVNDRGQRSRNVNDLEYSVTVKFINSISCLYQPTIGSGKRDFKVFYLIWAWPPSWLCDQHNVTCTIFLFPCTLKLTKFG